MTAKNQLEQSILNEKDFEDIDYNKFTKPKLIGTGGFGDVFKYELKDLNVAVVLKRLRFDTALNEEIIKLIEDFIKECKLLQSVCEDLNIIKFYGVTKDSDGHYNMVLQYANEGDLQQYLKTKFPILRWVDKLEIANGIACGLSFLHAKEIIHRDLHSRNILIHQGKPKIADFGASKQINRASVASDSNFIGVLEYTDPQCIIDGENKRSKKSDIYSFGIILWEISSGMPPFQSIKSTKSETFLSLYICVRGNREEPKESTPSQYLELYKKCWDHDPDSRPETNLIPNTLKNIIRDETQIKKGMENLEEAQSLDLERNRREMLAKIGESENQNETHEFEEALELYVKPRGSWNVPIIKTSNDKEKMDDEKMEEGDIEQVVDRFLASKDKLTSHDKEILEDAANEFLIKQENTSLIKAVNNFFEAENQLNLEDISALKVAADQFLALKDKKALELLEMVVNEFLESPKEIELKDVIHTLKNKSSFENELFIRVLESHIATEDVEILKKASKDKGDFITSANELLTLKAKEVLETVVNELLTSKRKKVLLILGSGGTGKSTFNRYFARRLWERAKKDMRQSIPLFIALAPLEELINKNQDFIETYLRERGKLSTDQIKELRNRKFVFILDGYDEIAERERHCYESNMFSEWKNAKIIISCRPEYLDESSKKKFWPKENGKRGFQELTLTPFSWTEIEQYIKNYVNYSKKNDNSPSWDADTYIRSIKNIPQIEDLVSNPILLKITLTVLPGLFEKKITSQINSIVLYDEFFKKWFERAQNRLQNIQLKPKERDEFYRLNKEGFTSHCLQFGKEFAFEMFVSNNKVVVDYEPVNEETASDLARFLGNTDLRLLLIRFSMPLFRRGSQYWFFHKSLRDYLIACALIDSLKDTSQTPLFNKQLIISEHAIQQFLVERVQQMSEHIPPLLNLIESSKKNANIRIASANAITILSRAKIPIPKNLNNVRVPEADLSNGGFNKAQFVRADLNNVNFQNANLRSASLECASLQNAYFKDADLTSANLQYANLQYAKLPSSSFRYADFKGAILLYVDRYLRTFAYKDAIEWIPFNNLSDVKEIGKGGYGSVYSAIWLDGIRKINGDDYNNARTREPYSIVAFRTLTSSKENDFDILKEFKSLMEYKFSHTKLAIYGITQLTKANEYLMVFKYVNNGNLYKYLIENFGNLTWRAKLQILKDISEELDNIHRYAGYFHANFHSGNILLNQRANENVQSYITDLELSRLRVSKGDIYGVMPYIAPEVLSGQKFTKVADIYAFGVIMSEMSTGQRPFDGHQFNIELALNICNGLRPEFAPGTPECYIKLAKMCMDSDPQKRPSANRVFNELHLWIENMERLDDDEIKKQFLDADQIIKTLPTISPIHPDNMYTSKIINTQRIVGGLKGYGKCECCNQYNTSEAWCQTCDPHRETQGWTSGDESVDNCIKKFQLNALAYTKVIEWIPFDRLNEHRCLARGGFGTVYFANWLDGIRKIDYVDRSFVRAREQSSKVVLKTLDLKEFVKYNLARIIFKACGLTRKTETNEYMMVIHGSNRDLRKFLISELKEHTWQTKLKLLVSISEELNAIHNAEYFHGDFHSGNIFLDNNMRSFVSDLGQSRKEDENIPTGNIYGVMPYVAPEVLMEQPYTKNADIYSFGIIMSEMPTGQRPFDGCEFNTQLATKICNGSRPKFASGTPDCYINLAKQCFDSKPQMRPTAYNIYNELGYWIDKIKGTDYVNEVIKHKINYGLNKIKSSYNVDKIKKCEIDYWHDKITNVDEIKKHEIDNWITALNNVDEIIIQLKYWLNKINDSKDVDEIKNQFNDWLDKIQVSDYVNEIIKHEIESWLDEIKMSDNIEEIIKQLKYWVDKINDSEGADEIKKQIIDQLDKIKGSDCINKIIKFKINCWLDEKYLDKVKEIKEQEISYWLDKIKGLDDVDGIKKQIKYWLNEIKGTNNLDEIKKQIKYLLDKIKDPDDIEKIKEQINYWVGKIKGLDNIDEITRQFLESDKIVSELPFNSPQHTDPKYTSKIINTQEILKTLKIKSIGIEIPEDNKLI